MARQATGGGQEHRHRFDPATCPGSWGRAWLLGNGSRPAAGPGPPMPWVRSRVAMPWAAMGRTATARAAIGRAVTDGPRWERVPGPG
jgi:hypothetical protein